jgi:hypothetical protein
MGKGKALACLQMDTEQEIRAEIKTLDSREDCRTWAEVEQDRDDRTWVYEALAERAQEVDGEL